MCKLLTFIFGLFLCVSCSNLQKSIYENSMYTIILTKKSNTTIKVKLKNKYTHFVKSYSAQLILVDGEVPEGSLRSDYNNPSMGDLYRCDSTYYINNKSINIAIAFENITHKRLDLSIYGSKISDYKDGSYTLYRTSQ